MNEHLFWDSMKLKLEKIILKLNSINKLRLSFRVYILYITGSGEIDIGSGKIDIGSGEVLLKIETYNTFENLRVRRCEEAEAS